VARRGFLAEIQYQSRQAAKRAEQQQRAEQRAAESAMREFERSQREALRLGAAQARASEKERKAAEKALAAAHVEARLAEVASLNAELQATYADVDGILAATLGVDDFVDLIALRDSTPEPPEFDPGNLGIPVPAVPDVVYAPQPPDPQPPKSGGLFGSKKRAAEAATIQAKYEAEIAGWTKRNQARYDAHQAAVEARRVAEEERLQALETARRAHLAAFNEQMEHRKQALQRLIDNLGFDVEEAIQEYVEIVLSNSVYPDVFPVDHDAEFNVADRELTLTVSVPNPGEVPAVKEYKYNKAKDEITETKLPVGQARERYASAVHQVSIRTLHEIFEADRAERIRTISLTVQTEHVSPSTGQTEIVPLVIVAANRETFSQFDLARVVPSATLETLGAAVSKKPYELVPADTSRGVRGQGRR
jgi:restriction system protein